MAGASNGLILCLLSMLIAPWAFGASAQNPQNESVIVPQSPTHLIALRNSTLSLNCGIKTTAEILDSWWLKDGIRLQNSSHTYFKGLDLTIEGLNSHSDINRIDDGKYRCVVKLHTGILLGPIQIVSIAALETTLCARSVLEGIRTQNVVLPCCVKSTPTGNVTWVKLNDDLISSRFIKLNSGNLLILNLTEGDDGPYRCVVENNVYGGVTQADVRLSIQESVSSIETEILDTFERDLTLSMQPVTLICAANGQPRPTVHWVVAFETNNKIETKIISSSSVILDSHNTTGNYTCVAANEFQQVAKSVLVKVVPSFPNFPLLTYPPAKTVRFECRSPLAPIIWYKDGERLHTNKGRVKHRNDELIISSSIMTDSGFYQCESENYIGTGRLSIKPPQEAVDSPVSPNCSSPSPTKIFVQWQSPSGKSIQAFSVHYTRLDGGVERQQVTNKYNTTLLIEALVPNTNYSIYVRSYSGRAASGQSQHIVCTTREDSPITAPTLLPTHQFGPPSQFRLRWKKLSKQEARGNILHYKLQWRVEDGSFSNVQILRGDSEEFIITGLTPSTHYSLRLIPATSVGYPVGKDLPWTNFETGSSNVTYSSPDLELRLVGDTIVAEWQHEFGSISISEEDDSGFRLFLGQLDDSISEFVFRPIIYLGPNEQEFVFTELIPGAQYQVSLQAFTGNWESIVATKKILFESGDSASNATNMVTIENLEAKPISATEISLKWSRPAQADLGYYVIRYKSDDSKDASYANSTNESLVIGKLQPFTSYEIDVAFQSNGTCGPFSQKVETVTLEGVPGPPLAPQFHVLNKTSIQVMWLTPEKSNGVIRGYLIELIGDSSQGPSMFTTTETKYIMTRLEPNKNYTLRVAAETVAGPGEFSTYLYPKIFNTNNTSTSTSRTAERGSGENGEMIQDRSKNNDTSHSESSTSGSNQQQLGLILGVVLSLISIVICGAIIVWRNKCFPFILSRGRRARTTTYMNGCKDTVDSPGMEMMNLRSRRNSQTCLDTKGGHPTVNQSGYVTDPLLIGHEEVPN